MIQVLTMKGVGVAAALLALAGCAGWSRTRPADMTVAKHERAAQEERAGAREAFERAASAGRGAPFLRYSALRHRELADLHARAAEELRREVSAACADAKATPPLGALRVERVEPIREAHVPRGVRHPRGFYPERLRGARIAVGLDDPSAVDATARAVRCDAARASAGLGPDEPASPFAVRTARTNVRAEGAGLVVDVRGDAGKAAEEILRRATALAPKAAR